MRSTLLFLAAALLLAPSALADDGLRWWSAPLTGYPLATGVEIQIVPSTPKVAGMPSIPAPTPSAFIAPKLPPVVDPPPQVIIRPIYLPRTYVRPVTTFRGTRCR
jgi:hypothetical protein